MTEDELKALKDLPAPPPRAEAKSMALAAALAAFDAGEKNNPDTAQGSEKASRLTHASQAKRRWPMRVSTVSMKMAASLVALTVATVGTLYFVTTQDGSRVAYEMGGEGERRTALLNRREETGGVLGGKIFPPAEKPVYDQLSNADGRIVASESLQKQVVPQQGQPPAADPFANPAMVEAEAPGDSPITGPVASGNRLGFTGRADQDDAKALTGKSESKLDQEEDSRFGANTKMESEPAKPAPQPSQRLAVAPPPVAPGQTVFEKGVAPQNLPREIAPGVLTVPSEERDRNQFEAPPPNPVKQVAAEPVSTFSIDVDTASYGFARRAINDGRLPPKDSVRVEEMVNYFPYPYPRPEAADAPFQPSVTVMPAPWKPANKLVHIGIKGYELVPAERPRANLVFLIDISGSMAPADRLPLVKNAFRLMLDELKPDDTVGIVTYASGSGIALEPTKVSEKGKILAAIDALGAGGSTAGAQGLSDAYRLAEANFDKAGVNRIILATDGDFNVGISNRDELKGFIERKRDAGIFLSILGVGEGNYNDALTQALAQNGNGTAAYVDTLNEARKVLVDEASSTLFTIARDVKIQVEFNPSQVAEYRLIGYETRALKREDFNNDKVDAGDVGSGHTVTAIYEITPKGAPKLVDELRYGTPGAAQPAESAGQGGEYGFLKLRYKLPKEQASKLITLPIAPSLEKSDIAAAPDDVRFSVAVAGFGQLLRGLPYLGNYNYDDVLALAQGARGADPYGYRAEFLNLVRLAKSARP